MTHAWIRVLAVLTLGTFLLTSASQAAETTAQKQQDLPEYRLQVGQELVYQGSYEQSAGTNISYSVDRWQFLVVDETNDHNWKVLFQKASAYEFGKDPKELDAIKEKANKKLDDGKGETVRRTFSQFEIDRHGRITGLNGIAAIMSPVHQLFVSLPKDQTEAKDGWKETLSSDDTVINSQLVTGAPDEIVVRSIPHSMMFEMYGIIKEQTSTFDRERGIPTRIVSKTVSDDEGEKRETIVTTELLRETKRSRQELGTYGPEAISLLKLVDEIQEKARANHLKEEALKQIFETEEARLAEFIDTIKSNDLKPVAEQQLTGIKNEAKYYMRSAKVSEAILAAPALDWKTTDLAGKDYSLEDLRGKVVVLDFWYRNCGWCIRAMPQVKALAEQFPQDQVVVLGVNRGDTLENANAVIEKMNLRYPNLKGETITQEYKIRGFPTLLVLDQQGVVRDIHIGYSPTLKDDVSKSIHALLTDKLTAK